MSIFPAPEPNGPSDEHAAESRLRRPVRLFVQYLWLNLLFVLLLVSNLWLQGNLDE
jgi:hypothetical protein